tara:strand:+ start:14 stop:373 length:360 start_codon:yes stop_codon:yes gene_type:complete
MSQPKSDSTEIGDESNDSSGFISVLITSFSTIFLAELGDKTQIATLMLSAQSGRPFIIFVGATIALVITSLLAVLIGRWIASNFPRQKFTFMAGIFMLSFGIYLTSQGFLDFLHNRSIN